MDETKGPLKDQANKVFEVELSLNAKPFWFIVDRLILLILVWLFLKGILPPFGLILAQLCLVIAEVKLNQEPHYENLSQHFKPLLNSKYGLQDVSISPKEPYVWLTFLTVIIGCILYFIFYQEWIGSSKWYAYVGYAFMSLMTATMTAYPVLSAMRFKTTSPLGYQVFEKIGDEEKKNVSDSYKELFPFPQRPEEDVIETDPIDKNDVGIIEVETKLKGINSRIEAYLLESVLLGGLAFTGFLTVITSGDAELAQVHFMNLFDHLLDYALYKCYDPSISMNEFLLFFRHEDLLDLVAFESLLSSVFFLLVLALRLRYMSLFLSLDHLHRNMKAFNEKEEEINNIIITNPEYKDVLSGRFMGIQSRINRALSDSSSLQGELNPVVTLMTVFRNLGILLFYTILVTSGFFFCYQITIALMLLAVFTMVFRVAETRMRVNRIARLLLRHK